MFGEIDQPWNVVMGTSVGSGLQDTTGALESPGALHYGGMRQPVGEVSDGGRDILLDRLLSVE